MRHQQDCSTVYPIGVRCSQGLAGLSAMPLMEVQALAMSSRSNHVALSSRWVQGLSVSSRGKPSLLALMQVSMSWHHSPACLSMVSPEEGLSSDLEVHSYSQIPVPRWSVLSCCGSGCRGSPDCLAQWVLAYADAMAFLEPVGFPPLQGPPSRHSYSVVSEESTSILSSNTRSKIPIPSPVPITRT